MSAKQVSLKSPITIAVVMVLLVGVVFLNVNTFGGKGKKTSRGYRVQAHPPVPLDAVSLAVYETQRPNSGTKKASVFSAHGLVRDPFLSQQNPTVTMANTAPKVGQTPKGNQQKTQSLECSAIMLGGTKSVAIINGEGYHIGQKIRNMTLTAVDADGVTLRKADGSSTHLAVGVQEEESQSYRVVTRSRKIEDQGRTRLVDQ